MNKAQKILIPLWSFVWCYWLDEKDTVVHVCNWNTALIDRHGQRRKSSPMVLLTIKNRLKNWLNA